jgi:transcriptional regulator with XRE-family HTH domain
MSGWQKVDADRLRELRVGRMLSQAELAKMAQTTQATISGFERSRRTAQPKTVRKLADALGVEPRELVGATQEEEEEEVGEAPSRYHGPDEFGEGGPLKP